MIRPRLRAIHLKADYTHENPYCLSARYFDALSAWLPEMPIAFSVSNSEMPGCTYCVELAYVDDLPEDAEVQHLYGSYPH